MAGGLLVTCTCLRCEMDRPFAAQAKSLKSKQTIQGSPAFTWTSRTITLFAEAPSVRRGPSGFVVSALVHLAVICLGYAYLRQAVRVQDLIVHPRYNVRLIRVEPPQLRRIRSGGSDGGTPDLSAEAMRAAGPAGQASPLIHEVVRPIRAAQTLVQPDLPPDLLAKQVPLPQVMIWTAGRTPGVTLAPPPPKPLNAPVKYPSLEVPNDQLNIAEMKIAPSAISTSALTVLPSTTTPIAVKRAAQPMQMPALASAPVGTATPARVISLSEIQMQRGTIALPAINELAAAMAWMTRRRRRAWRAAAAMGQGSRTRA